MEVNRVVLVKHTVYWDSFDCQQRATKNGPTIRGSGVPQAVAGLSFTWRAPSSPRHACGLNVSFFLHTCRLLKPAQAGGCVRECWAEKACRSLQGWGKCNGCSEQARAAILRGGSGKGLVFKMGWEMCCRPVFTGGEG
jgi:hypothetical protein